jgi:hypothetical protein
MAYICFKKKTISEVLILEAFLPIPLCFHGGTGVLKLRVLHLLGRSSTA